MTRNQLIPLLPVVVLLLVAGNQILLTETEGLSFWKGGGFGMFASINDRFSHIHLHEKGEVKCADFPKELKSDLRRTEIFPSYSALGKLVEEYSRRDWIYYTKTTKGASQLAARMIEEGERDWDKRSLVNFDQLSLEVWDIQFDAATLQVVPKKIREMGQGKKSNE